MKTRILLAGAVALAFAAGTVALPSLADAAQQFHGGGGHAGGGHGGGYHGGGGAYYGGGGVYYGGMCGPMQVVLGLCGPYGY
jgi:uncharacterized membrane protein YgcG